MSVAEQLNHSDDWHAQRKKGIGGSDAKKIMEGDWFALWEEKTGRREGEDLSGILQVQLGSFTEDFNRFWFEKQTGLPVLTENCESLFHSDHGFMQACRFELGAGKTVDGNCLFTIVVQGEISCRHR